MADRTYPYKAWVLMPSFKPKEVELVKPHAYGGHYPDHEISANRTCYHLSELYPSKAAAIAAGREKIAKQEVDLAKKQANLAKRIAALDKAEAT